MRIRGFTQDDAHIFCTKEQVADEVALAARLRADRAAGLRVRRLHVQPVDQGPESKYGRHRRGLGRGHRGAAPARSRRTASSYAVKDGRRRVLRAEDRHRRHGRHRPDVAAVDHPGRLPAARALRPGVRRRRRRAAPADHDPPGAVRLDRAVLRRADRALRRRVPGVAGARCRSGCCRSPRPTRTTRTRSSTRSQAAGFRVDSSAADEPLGKRIRNAKMEKIPYVLVVGDDDVAARHRRRQPARRRGRARRAGRRVRRPARRRRRRQ